MTNLKVIEIDLTNLRNQVSEALRAEVIGTKASIHLAKVQFHLGTALDALQKHNKHVSDSSISPAEPTTSVVSS